MGKKKDKKSSVSNKEVEKDTTDNESEVPTVAIPSKKDENDKIEPGEEWRENPGLNTSSEDPKPTGNGSEDPLLTDIHPNSETTYDQSIAQDSVKAKSLLEEEVKQNKTDLVNKESVELEQTPIEPIESHTQDIATSLLNVKDRQSKEKEQSGSKADSSELNPPSNSTEEPRNGEEPTDEAASSELNPLSKNGEEPTNEAASSEPNPLSKNGEEPTNEAASSEPNPLSKNGEEPTNEAASSELNPLSKNGEEPTNEAASSEPNPLSKNGEEPANEAASSEPNPLSKNGEEPRSERTSYVPEPLPVDVNNQLTKQGSSSIKPTSPLSKRLSIEASSTPSLPKQSSLAESPHLELKGDSNGLSSPTPVPLKSPVHLPLMGSPKAFKEEGSPKRHTLAPRQSKNLIHGGDSKVLSKDHSNDTSDHMQDLKESQEVTAEEDDSDKTKEIPKKKGLNFLSPTPINVPENATLEDLEKIRTADLMDVDLNDASDDTTAKAELTTPAKTEKSKDPEKNAEGSTISNLISRLSPNRRPETQSSISPPLPPRGSSTKKHSVPPPLEQEMQSEDFRRNLASTRARDSKGPARPSLDRAKRLDSAAEINLIANRFKETRQSYQTEDETSKENIERGQSALKSSFSTFLESLPATPVKPTDKIEQPPVTVADLSPDAKKELHDDELHLLKTDWFFWTQVVNDFGSVAANPEKLEKKIADGIPQEIRGIIWQLIANSKSVEFEDIYNTLHDTASSHESSIRRDMKRTKFIPENKFENLFNVIKVYSVFDPDVGYTQGMAFIVTPLLLNTETEAEAFGLLVRLMKGYGLRKLYLQEMPGLMLMLYQFDRLLEEHSPQLYNHLTRQGVRSSMYATQWFLTFFAYKFPLEFVLRIYDIVFMEGVESFLKFAVNLVLKNIDSLLNLQFDKLLDFLKDELFFYYLKANVEQRKIDLHSEDSLLKKDISSIDSSQKHAVIEDEEYDVDQFVHDAMNDVHITPISLRRYTSEYDEIHEIEQQKEAQYESMRIKNRQLQKEVRKLENSYTLLNREHVDIANELIKNRLKIETLSDENNDMKITILELRKQLDEVGRKQSTSSPDNGLPSDIRQDLKRTIKRNSEVMNENLKLQDRVTELEKLLATWKTQQAVTASANPAPNVPREKSSTSWSGFRKVFKKEEGAPPK